LVTEGLLDPVPTHLWAHLWYNPNDKCAYHGDVRVTPQKTAIHELISAGSIKLNPVDNEILKTYGQAKKCNCNITTNEREAGNLGADFP
jgi:hypothetical protein